MHFDNLYPDVNVGYKSKEYPGLIKYTGLLPSYFCKMNTPWWDIVSKQAVCCKKCLDYAREKEWFKNEN